MINTTKINREEIRKSLWVYNLDGMGTILIKSPTLEKLLKIEHCDYYPEYRGWVSYKSNVSSVIYSRFLRRAYIFIRDEPRPIIVRKVKKFIFVPYTCRNCKYFKNTDVYVETDDYGTILLHYKWYCKKMFPRSVYRDNCIPNCPLED